MSSRVFELFVLPCQLLMLLIWIAEQSKHLPLFNLIFLKKSINLIFFINEVHYIVFFFLIFILYELLSFAREAGFHILITSYQLLVSDEKYFRRVKWQYMVLDEAQAIKSSNRF